MEHYTIREVKSQISNEISHGLFAAKRYKRHKRGFEPRRYEGARSFFYRIYRMIRISAVEKGRRGEGEKGRRGEVEKGG